MFAIFCVPGVAEFAENVPIARNWLVWPAVATD
jgi:hypothetical protein